MLAEASVTTNRSTRRLSTGDAAMRRISGRPFGLRRQRAVCVVVPPRRILVVIRQRRRSLHTARWRSQRRSRGLLG